MPQRWYFSDGVTQNGPFTLETLARLALEGAVRRESLVWMEGWPEWKPAFSITEIFPSSPPLPSKPVFVPPPLPARIKTESTLTGPAFFTATKNSQDPTLQRPSAVNNAAAVGFLLPSLLIIMMVVSAATGNDLGLERPGGAVIILALGGLALLVSFGGQFVGSAALFADKLWGQTVLALSCGAQIIIYLGLCLATLSMGIKGSKAEILIILGGNGFILKSVFDRRSLEWFKFLKSRSSSTPGSMNNP